VLAIHLTGGCEENRAMPSVRTRSQEAQTETQEVLLNIKKHFFTLRVTKHCHRLPREVVESPSLEILKSHLDMVLDSLL